MPNWSSNRIAIRGTKHDVINFINKGMNKKLHNTQVTYDMPNNDIIKYLNEIADSKQPLTLRSWLPMPKTFIKWDTTNEMRSFDNWFKHITGEWGFEKPSAKTIKKYKAMSNDELKAEYEKYVKGWNKAKEEQLKKYGVVGWYDYNNMTLGTKWDAHFEYFDYMESGDKFILLMSCETAWSFPDAWLKTMQKENKELDFLCYAVEESYEYCGYFRASDEDWIENHDNLYGICRNEAKENESEDDEDSINELVYELLEEKQEEIYSHFQEYLLAE